MNKSIGGQLESMLKNGEIRFVNGMAVIIAHTIDLEGLTSHDILNVIYQNQEIRLGKRTGSNSNNQKGSNGNWARMPYFLTYASEETKDKAVQMGMRYWIEENKETNVFTLITPKTRNKTFTCIKKAKMKRNSMALDNIRKTIIYPWLEGRNLKRSK